MLPGWDENTDPCGGVSILEVDEAPCREISSGNPWKVARNAQRSLVPLAIIENYIEGNPVTDADIDNRIRLWCPAPTR